MESDRRVTFHPQARAELEEASLWYAQRSRVGLSRFLIAVERAVELITELPRAWPALDEGLWIIRVNDQYRITFELEGGVAMEVTCRDYH